MSAVAHVQPQEMLSLFVVEDAGRGGLESYLPRVLERCGTWFRASGATLFLETEVPGVFRLAAKHGPSASAPEGTTISAGEGIAGTIVARGTPAILIDPPHSVLPRRADIGSSIIVPLVNQTGSSRCIGVLNLARSREEPPFGDGDLLLAEAIAHQVALAVNNAALYAEAKHLGDTLRVVLAHVGFGLLALNGDSHVTLTNPEAAMMLGYVPEHGEPIEAVVAKVNEEFKAPILSAAHQGVSGKRFRSRQSMMGRVWTVSATPLPSSGCTITIEDVTELEHAQREYDRLRRLAEVGQMTATIAHEIRNPLTGIRSAAKMIKETPELSEEFADIVEAESLKLGRLCDEFLEFARPLKLEIERRPLGPLAEHVVSLLRPEFDAAGVELLCNIIADPDLHLDSRRMEQVLRNLILNALQATSRGGQVEVTVAACLLVIQDTGCGMAEDVVARLFSPFFTTKPRGTGLGLSMVRKIIDAHEATVGVQSVVGVGTRFEIRFPEEKPL